MVWGFGPKELPPLETLQLSGSQGTGSCPPACHGWQRANRLADKTAPFTKP